MLGNNATVLPLRNNRSTRRTLYFMRAELNQLLGLYSRNVARGVWRDYAIDHRDGQALFSVFRHTHESAAYTIVKSAGPGANQGANHAANQGAGEAQFLVYTLVAVHVAAALMHRFVRRNRILDRMLPLRRPG